MSSGTTPKGSDLVHVFVLVRRECGLMKWIVKSNRRRARDANPQLTAERQFLQPLNLTTINFALSDL